MKASAENTNRINQNIVQLPQQQQLQWHSTTAAVTCDINPGCSAVRVLHAQYCLSESNLFRKVTLIYLMNIISCPG